MHHTLPNSCSTVFSLFFLSLEFSFSGMDGTAPNNLPTPEATTNSQNGAVLEHPNPQNDAILEHLDPQDDAVKHETNYSEETHQNSNPQNDAVTHEINKNEEIQQSPDPQNDDAMDVDEEGDEQTPTGNGVGESAEDIDNGAYAAVGSVGIDAGNVSAVVANNGSKNKKKKNNCVWIMRSARKSKKRAKFSGNSGGAELDDEKVLITPVTRANPDKIDDTVDMKICLSKAFKAEKVELSEDRLTASSCKGYRMVRATRGVAEGAWYFEIKVVHLGETGHTRLGWSNEKGDLQAPVGYDENSYGYRDIDGSKIHKALRESYGDEGYKEGDVIGCYVSLPDGGLYAPKPQKMVLYKGQRYFRAAADSADQKEDVVKIVPGSVISFFKNGICQGVAFKDLSGGRYYPAASMYTLPNQSNCEVRFNFGPEFDFYPEDFGEYPIPRPMIEVPYQGNDLVVENGASDENKQQ